ARRGIPRRGPDRPAPDAPQPRQGAARPRGRDRGPRGRRRLRVRARHARAGRGDQRLPRLSVRRARVMADPQTPAPVPDAARRDLNRTIARRQKLLLGGIGGLALFAGGWFIFGGEDETAAGDKGAVTIDTSGIVDRNLSQREF